MGATYRPEISYNWLGLGCISHRPIVGRLALSAQTFLAKQKAPKPPQPRSKHRMRDVEGRLSPHPPLSSRLEGLGSVVSSPSIQRSIWKRVLVHLELERTHPIVISLIFLTFLRHIFSHVHVRNNFTTPAPLWLRLWWTIGIILSSVGLSVCLSVLYDNMIWYDKWHDIPHVWDRVSLRAALLFLT